MKFEFTDIESAIKSYPWSNQSAYANWLSQIYYIVRHSTPMLALACGRSLNNREFHLRCIEHLSEEKGHDKLILNDMKNMGVELYPELPSTMLVYQTQYYQIEHVNPTSFMGYIMFLELLATELGDFVYSKVKDHSPKSVSFLKLHINEDKSHTQKGYDAISTMPENEKRFIIQNFEMTKVAYITMILKSGKTTMKAA